MTSQQIKAHIERWHLDQASANPQWEIAYQLSVMNEREDVPKLKHNPFGESLGSPVREGSDTEVRKESSHDYVSSEGTAGILYDNPCRVCGKDSRNRIHRAADQSGIEGFEPPPVHYKTRGIEGFEPPPVHYKTPHAYERSHPENRFCGKCGAGEFHAIHIQQKPEEHGRTLFDIAGVLRSCAKTILENQMDPADAADYLNGYADAVSRAKPSQLEIENRRIAQACHQIQHDCAFCGRSMSDHRLPGEPEWSAWVTTESSPTPAAPQWSPEGPIVDPADHHAPGERRGDPTFYTPDRRPTDKQK